MDTETSPEVVFETDTYQVETSPAIGEGLPVVLGDQVIYVDGYKVVSKLTGQTDGEFRSLAVAMASAYEWDKTIAAVKQAVSGIKVPTRTLKGLN